MDIEANDACYLELSEVKTVGNRIQVPYRIYEDHLVDADFDPCDIEDEFVYYQPPVTVDDIRMKRLRNYHADVWWPELDGKGLLLPSTLVRVSPNLITVLQNIPYPAFIRTHVASPKDVKRIPVFTNYQEAYHTLITSERTRKDLSWILWAPPQKFLIEARCFCYRRKLTAMCPYKGSGTVQMLTQGYEWLKQHLNILPYWDCVIDIALTPNGWFILEINGFGADLNTGGGAFSWYEDYALLHGALPFEIRY